MDQGTAQARVKPHIIERPRLIRLLDEAASDVIILSAPAGYGKTTLARQWLAESGRISAWHQVTTASLDLAVLASAVAQACSAINPLVGEALVERLKVARKSALDPAGLAEILAHDLVGWPDSAWLVLDDYHTLLESSAAETFIERLITLSSARTLILTRRRPTWLTARHLLYGDAHELGVNALAMTQDEAAAVLEADRDQRVSGLVALAQGWPAVIGLAALTATSLVEISDLVPETLHTYFAEELYQCLPPELKQALLQLSFAPKITSELGLELFGSEGERLLGRCVEFGFLTSFRPGHFELHPLLRQFLATKVEKSGAPVDLWIEKLGTFLLNRKAWDDASVLLERTAISELVDRLLEQALYNLLLDGRIETLRRWIARARDREYTSPQIDLAEAELLFREGKPQRAEELALAASENLPPVHPLLARTLSCAGYSAQFDNRADEALDRHRKAASVARTIEDRRHAIWGQFVAQAEMNRRNEAATAIRLFEETQPSSIDDRLRQAQAHLTNAVRWGGIREAVRHWRHFLQLVDARCDPLVRTGFLQTLGQALFLSADYEDALAISYRQEAEATRLGLDFVLPHAWSMRMAAQIGVHDFSAARDTLKCAVSKVHGLGDDHSVANLGVLEAKMLLAESLGSRALTVLEQEPQVWASPAMAGEFIAMHAFAAACCGDLDGAERFARDSAGLSDQVEAFLPRIWAEGIATHRRSGDEAGICLAFDAAFEVGYLDSVVLAYRAYRPALTTLARIVSYRSGLRQLFSSARDYGLARQVRLAVNAPPERAAKALTEREREVVGLLRHGLSNAEIARALWIEESTAKVHVRHILRKLGARTRTEAAVLAGRLDLPPDAPSASAFD